jgi:hypothetical protein
MKALLEHRHFQSEGRWVSEFAFRICVGATLHSLKFLDPGIDNRFKTEEAAIQRNRDLARNWCGANMPCLELFESRA